MPKFCTPRLRGWATAMLAAWLGSAAAHPKDTPPAADQPASAEDAIVTAWSDLAPHLADSAAAASPTIVWTATADALRITLEVGAGAPCVSVDPRTAEEIERVLEATTLAVRLQLRVALRTYAVERAVALVERDTVAITPQTFWDWLGWSGARRMLVRDQATFQARVKSMREQTYRWLLARAITTPPALAPDERATRTAQAMVDSDQWPFTPLAVAILLAAREAPADAGPATWLCRAAAVQFAGASQLRRDASFQASLGSDERRQRAVRELLVDLAALNDEAGCGLSW